MYRDPDDFSSDEYDYKNNYDMREKDNVYDNEYYDKFYGDDSYDSSDEDNNYMYAPSRLSEDKYTEKEWKRITLEQIGTRFNIVQQALIDNKPREITWETYYVTLESWVNDALEEGLEYEEIPLFLFERLMNLPR